MTIRDSRSSTRAPFTWHEHGSAERPGGPIWREPGIVTNVLVMLVIFGALLAMLGFVGRVMYQDYLRPEAAGGNLAVFGAAGLLLFFFTLLAMGVVAQVRTTWLRGVPPTMLRTPDYAPEGLDDRLNSLLQADEQVLWARRLNPTRRLAGGAELLTSQRALRLVGRHVTAIRWNQANRVTFSLGRAGADHVVIVGPPQRESLADQPTRIVLDGCTDRAAVAAALRLVLAPPRSGPPAVGATIPAGWKAMLSKILVEGEQVTWAGRPQRFYRLTLLDRLGRLCDFNHLSALVMLSLIAMVGLPALTLFRSDSNSTPPIELIWAAWLFAVVCFYARPSGRAPRYVITDRRALQVQASRLTGRIKLECYRQLDPDLLRIQRPILAALLPGSVNLILAVERHGITQTELAFRDLSAFEAATAVSFLRSFGPSQRVEPGRVPVTRWESQLVPKAVARVKALLRKNEQVLWAGAARVTDAEQPFGLRAYVLTDQRAIVSANEPYLRANQSLNWEQIRRVKIEQRADGTGTVTFVIPTTLTSSADHIGIFRRCPQLATVRRLIEQQLFGENTAGTSGSDGIEAVRTALLATQVPEEWRGKVAHALLPGEQAHWIGRADSRVIRFIWWYALIVGVVIAAIIATIAFFAANMLLLGAMIAGAVLIVLGAQLVMRRMVNLAYVVTNKRALQVGAMDSPQRQAIEFYPGVEQARIWSSINASYDQLRRAGPGCADIHISDRNANNEQGGALASFIAVPRDAVATATRLLKAAYGEPNDQRAQATREADPPTQNWQEKSAQQGAPTAAVKLTIGQWSSWHWLVLAIFGLLLSGGLAFAAVAAERFWIAVAVLGVGVFVAGPQLWRHGIVLARGLASSVALEQLPLKLGQRSYANVSVRGRGLLQPLRVALVCRGCVRVGRRITERVLHEEILAEVEQLELHADASWQHRLDFSIPADVACSRVPEGSMIMRRGYWQNGYNTMRSFRKVRTNGITEWKELGYGEADFEWVTWAIEVQANGGWGARWVAFTHHYPFQVVASTLVQASGEQ